jgi:protein-arginine kinase activator protein McsA
LTRDSGLVPQDSLMVCDRCGKRPVSTVSTVLVEGRKQAAYLCDVCRRKAVASTPALERPCVQCRTREGTVKLVRLKNGRRMVSYLCEVCARSGGEAC